MGHDRGKPCHYYTQTRGEATYWHIRRIVVTGLAPVMLSDS